jgi:hypothetical protein
MHYQRNKIDFHANILNPENIKKDISEPDKEDYEDDLKNI